RMRFDSDDRQSGDFERAVEHWTKALQLNPNQYIWRRRIQQFGPILDKPYPFYNWIDTAQADLIDRGETPTPISVPPTESELAQPSRTRNRITKSVNLVSPDPESKIQTDDTLSISQIVVPATDSRKTTVRLHLLLQPGVPSVGWNNEADPVTVWIDAEQDVTIPKPLLTIAPNAEASQKATSNETRTAEVEISWKGDRPEKLATGYVLYHRCDKQTGQCSFWRQNFTVK
ncbi:MAG: tetratricopeptide repeat protein, partial [Planctomycetota bacterium]